MRRGAPVLIALLTLAAPVSRQAGAQARPPHLYGPEPTWNEYRKLAEATIIGRLIDPESARITWLTGIYKGEFKPVLEPHIAGYWACGRINAKNRLGGYTGAHTFVVAIDYDRVLYADVDPGGTGTHDAACARVIREGLFPPVPDEPEAASSTSAGVSAPPLANVTTGVALRAMPEGAYVTAVVPGSPAATAGLKPGMVITSVNAIPLAGMGDAMLKVVDAAGTTATLTLVGGATVRMRGQP